MTTLDNDRICRDALIALVEERTAALEAIEVELVRLDCLADAASMALQTAGDALRFYEARIDGASPATA